MTFRLLRPLTDLQARIALRIGVDDWTYRQIAEELSISEHTVTRHVQNIALVIDADGLRDLPPRTVVQLFVQTTRFWETRRSA